MYKEQHILPLPPASCYSMSAHVRSSCLHTRTDWGSQHLLTRCQAFDVSKIAQNLFDPLKMLRWLLSRQITNLRSNPPNTEKNHFVAKRSG